MEMNRIVKGLSRMSHFLTCSFSLRRCSAVSREGMLCRGKRELDGCRILGKVKVGVRGDSCVRA